MSNNQKKDLKKIMAFLNGEMSDKKTALFKKWLEIPSNLSIFKEYAILNHKIELTANRFDAAKNFKRFLKTTQQEKSKVIKLNRLKFLKYVAVFAGLSFGIAFFVNQQQKASTNGNEITLEIRSKTKSNLHILEKEEKLVNTSGETIASKKENQLIYNSPEKELADDLAEVNILTVPYGKKIQLTLADGTVVDLNSGSILTYPSHFKNTNIREVTLEGEGHFTVTTNKEKPFIVNTNAIRTKVFGTKFNISHYTNDPFSEVVLVEGSVGVTAINNTSEDSKNIIMLKPNQKLQYLKEQQSMKVTDVEVYPYISWINEVMIFKNEPFDNIIRKLERRFNLQIEIKNKAFTTERFTGNFDIESIETIMNTFLEDTTLNYTIDNGKLTIN